MFSIDRVCSLVSDSSEPGARILKNQRPGKFALESHSTLTFDIFGQHCAALNLRISIQEPPCGGQEEGKEGGGGGSQMTSCRHDSGDSSSSSSSRDSHYCGSMTIQVLQPNLGERAAPETGTVGQETGSTVPEMGSGPDIGWRCTGNLGWCPLCRVERIHFEVVIHCQGWLNSSCARVQSAPGRNESTGGRNWTQTHGSAQGSKASQASRKCTQHPAGTGLNPKP